MELQNNQQRLADVMRAAKDRLLAKFDASEATQLLYFAVEQLKGWTKVQVAMNGDAEVTQWLVDRLDDVVARLINDEPIQYIFGKAYFYGMWMTVDNSTLIPRPETAELVDRVVADFGARRDLRVLDLGTGSGCIAVALARNLPFASVTAIDISAEALSVARKNAADLKARVDFRQLDMLDRAAMNRLGEYDVIVSNPPYIIVKEAETMEANVLDHEPMTALFVPDADPLRFYRPIADFAVDHLADRGALYLEVNPMFATDVKRLFVDRGFADVDIVKDFQSKNRFVIARK